MMKKLLFTLLLIFSSFVVQSQIAITTVSTSSAWSPRSVTNTGNILQWEANNALIGTLTQTSDIPTFDFSANDGSPINITVTSTDAFAGLTRFQVYTLDITAINTSQAVNLDNYHIGNSLLSTIDISANVALTLFRVSTNDLTSIDISSNPLLTRLELADNDLPVSEIDAVVNQIDAFGLSGGILTLAGNIGGLSNAAQPAYDNLIAKGWTIDVSAPQPPIIETMTITTTSTSSSWSPRSVTNTGNRLQWEASNGLIGTLTQLENVPTFDFSANDGSPINITITSNDGFAGLTRFQVYTLGITDIDASQATQLDNYHVQANSISTIDISTLTNVTFFRALDNNLSTIDISNNALLSRLEVENNSLSSAELDAIVNQLDAFGLLDGILHIAGNQGLTAAAQPAYDNLIAKGWEIDVPAPGPPVIATMTIVTTSTSATWSPRSVTNTGNAFEWEATNALIGTLTATSNNPTFDFSANDGSPINITITSNDGFVGLTRFQVYTLDITDIDATEATQLDNYHVQANAISTIDISTLTNVTFFRALDNNLSTLDISNNALLSRLEVENNSLTSTELDAIVNQLDAFGLLDGILHIAGNQGLTAAAQPAYDNLIAKGWEIDVSAPQPPVIATMTIVTTSTSATWSPRSVTNTGNAFEWEATNALIGTLTATSNDPTFDFSANDGSPINITITSNDGFVGLTRFQVYTLDITDIDATEATQLDNYHVQANAISTIDISTLANVTFFRAFQNSLSTLDISNNPLLVRLEVSENNLGSNELDAIVNQLDTFGLLDGFLVIAGNAGNLTSAAQPAYDNLIAKGWTIDVSAPAPPIIETMTLTTTSTSAVWSPRSVTNTGNTLQWEATNALIGTLTATSNDPTFDFSANDGSPISITVTSDDGFAGLTRFQVYTLNITDIDASQAELLDNYHVQVNSISNMDISTNVNLTFFRAFLNNLSTLDISNNPLLIRLEISDNNLSSVELDAIVNQLDTFGLLDGILVIANNAGNLTLAAQPSYDNLIAKGWSIDVGPPAAPGPVIDVLGNGISIANGDLIPDVADDTDFGPVINGGSKTNTFTIQNTGVSDLTIAASGIKFSFGSDIEFFIDNISENLPFDLVPNASMTFDVIFIPSVNGNYEAFVEIDNSDPNQNPFRYAVGGEGADIVVSGDIMITQYYNNTTGDNWIEVKNISGGTIPGGTYFLALYDQAAIPNITSQVPTASESIPELLVDEVILFDNSASLPTTPNLGNVTIISTPVCNFDGNDVILISSTIDTACYSNRQDIVGDVPVSSWGTDISLIRGGSASETPDPFFDINNWIVLSPSADVDVASTNTNIALGIQGVGPTVWNGTTWDNFDPDKTRTVEISGNYDASIGNIESYNLIVNTGNTLNFDSGTTNSVVIDGNLTVNGTFIIGDQESLVMTNDNGVVIGNVTKNENSISRNNTHDFTYWSSPIVNANIGTVFAGVTPSRIFEFEASLQVSDPNDPNYYAPWLVASGVMTRGKGYAAEGLTGSTGIHNISFTGVPNNGLVEFDVFDNPDGDLDNDFNLIGNPYPSAINIETFFLVNAGLVDPIVYLWTHNSPISGGDSGDFINSDYATYNFTGGTGSGFGTNPNNPSNIPDKNIGSSQGFFIRAVGSGLVVFNNNMRMIDANDQFYKLDNSKNKTNEIEKDRVWLKLTTDKGGYNQILVGFTDKASEGIDKGYDALKFMGSGENSIYFYSVIENKKYVIQGLNSFSANKSVSLGYDANVAPRSLTIGIDKTEGALKDAEVYLVDHILNITHDLKNSDYQFEQTATGENLNRFTLQFTASGATLAVEELNSLIDFVVSNDFESLKINSKKSVNEIRVYDLLGRMLIQENPNKKSFQLNAENIKNGTILLIEATLENGSVVSKKTIKY